MFNILLFSFIACFVIERLFVGWKLPKVHSWYTRVVVVNVIQLSIVLIAGFSWEKWFSKASLFHLSDSVNPWAAGFIAYFIATFVFYWWHRLRHESDFFWKYFHQIHHSPQRLEVITSFYKHPLEMTVNSILGSLIVYAFLGLSLEAGAIYTLFTALGEFFYHTNVKSPRWIGYIFQRPEMHRIHHQYNKHKNNYGDFAIWDIMFGTFENPKTWSDHCGFDEAKELRLKDMLLFKDVHKLVLPLAVLIGVGMGAPAPALAQHNYSSLSEACESAKSIVAEGDLIFTDIPLLPFRKVAETTNSWTSHVGIIFLNESGEWIVSESKVPLAKDTPLCDFIKNSADFRFEVRRLNRPLEKSELIQLRKTAKSMLGHWYDLGFNYDSKRLFCSKFAYLTYQSIGIEVGELQTFKQLMEANPRAPQNFWKAWYLGSIPWERHTVSPASQLKDPKFSSVVKVH